MNLYEYWVFWLSEMVSLTREGPEVAWNRCVYVTAYTYSRMTYGLDQEEIRAAVPAVAMLGVK